ncbi:MAG: hypothetical protein IKL48_04475 [Elusimicrobiaceae bacterium]|nr:hypothetical protein [Elusimicrobiaceae bacterium]
MKSKKIEKNKDLSQEDSATIAASSLAQYFKDKNWKIISFFPNTKCCQRICSNDKKISSKKSK